MVAMGVLAAVVTGGGGWVVVEMGEGWVVVEMGEGWVVAEMEVGLVTMTESECCPALGMKEESMWERGT